MPEMIDPKFLRESLKRQREREGLTLKQVHEVTGISIATLSRIERGQFKEIEGSTLINLLGWLGISMEEVKKDPIVKKRRALPDVVELHLRADKKFNEKTASALAKMFRTAYEELSEE